MQWVQWIIDHREGLYDILLLINEIAAATCQLIWPDNKGFLGFTQTFIKFLQGMKAKQLDQP